MTWASARRSLAACANCALLAAVFAATPWATSLVVLATMAGALLPGFCLLASAARAASGSAGAGSEGASEAQAGLGPQN